MHHFWKAIFSVMDSISTEKSKSLMPSKKLKFSK